METQEKLTTKTAVESKKISTFFKSNQLKKCFPDIQHWMGLVSVRLLTAVSFNV